MYAYSVDELSGLDLMLSTPNVKDLLLVVLLRTCSSASSASSAACHAAWPSRGCMRGLIIRERRVDGPTAMAPAKEAASQPAEALGGERCMPRTQQVPAEGTAAREWRGDRRDDDDEAVALGGEQLVDQLLAESADDARLAPHTVMHSCTRHSEKREPRDICVCAPWTLPTREILSSET